MQKVNIHTGATVWGSALPDGVAKAQLQYTDDQDEPVDVTLKYEAEFSPSGEHVVMIGDGCPEVTIVSLPPRQVRVLSLNLTKVQVELPIV